MYQCKKNQDFGRFKIQLGQRKKRVFLTSRENVSCPPGDGMLTGGVAGSVFLFLFFSILIFRRWDVDWRGGGLRFCLSTNRFVGLQQSSLGEDKFSCFC